MPKKQYEKTEREKFIESKAPLIQEAHDIADGMPIDERMLLKLLIEILEKP